MEKLHALLRRHKIEYESMGSEEADKKLLERRLSYSDLDEIMPNEETATRGREPTSPRKKSPLSKEERAAEKQAKEAEDSNYVPNMSPRKQHEVQTQGDIEADPPQDEHEPYTIMMAESHVIHGADEICHVKHSQSEFSRIKELLKINCIHRGDLDSHVGKRYLVAVDGTASSRRAFDAVIKLADPHDHIIVITIRDKAIPQQMADDEHEEILLRYELWKSAKRIVRPLIAVLNEEAPKKQLDFTVLIPDAWDSRKLICNLAKQFRADFIALGRHESSEKNKYHRHFRSMGRYVTHHAKCRVMLL